MPCKGVEIRMELMYYLTDIISLRLAAVYPRPRYEYIIMPPPLCAGGICFPVNRPSGISRETHESYNRLFGMLMCPNHMPNWLDFGHSMLIFFQILALFR